MDPRATSRRIGRFEVIRQLGRGTQGTVWLAHDPQLRRDVAIKTIDVSAGEDPAAVRTLLEEAVMMSRLVHPNIVTLFDAGRDGTEPYLVFEYVPGSTLSALISESGCLAPARACDIAIQLLRGVEFAHDKGVVHRDIKPSNVMIAEDGTPRIMDFGIAALVSSRDADDGGFHGTPAYAAPEYITDRRFSPASDISSMGMVIYQMLTGTPAVTGRTVWEVLHKVTTGSFEPPSARGSGVDAELDAIVMRALARNPDERHPSARAFREALEARRRSDAPAEPGPATSALLEFVLHRVRMRSDFPALSATIGEVSRVVDSPKQGVHALSEAILKDFGLTNKLLRFVNAARYGQAGRGITTVSRAIMIVGFDQVRAIACGLVLFDHLRNPDQAAGLRDELVAAWFAGNMGRALAAAVGQRDAEEAFVAAMFHNLGRIVTAFYLHEEFVEIQSRVEHGADFSRAALEVLGLPVEELGAGVARTWKLPDRVVAAMRPLPDPLRPAASDADRLHLLVGIACTITDAIRVTPPEQRSGRLLAIHQRFQPVLGLQQPELLMAIGRAVSTVLEDEQTLDMGARTSPFFARAMDWSSQFSESGGVSTLSDTLSEAVVPEAHATEAAAAAAAAAPAAPERVPGTPQASARVAARRAALANGVREATDALVDGRGLSEVLRLVVDVVREGTGLRRVLLFTRDGTSGTLVARFGSGEGAEALVRQAFAIPAGPARDVFQAAMARGEDLFVADVDEARIRAYIPDWVRKTLGARSMALFPIGHGQRTVALLYGDLGEPGSLTLEPEDLSLLKTLRNQVMLAIRNQHE